MMQLILPLVFALVGLALYALLVRRAVVPLLGPGVLLLGIAGVGILRLLPNEGDENSVRTLIALAMLWVGWIGLTALVAQFLNRRMPDLAPLPVVTGAVATLAPVAGYLIVKTFS